MRISDWSSDVCSSDLLAGGLRGLHVGLAGERHLAVGVHGHAVSGAVAEAGAAFEGDADRKSVVKGKCVSVRVDPGGRCTIKKKVTLFTACIPRIPNKRR